MMNTTNVNTVALKKEEKTDKRISWVLFYSFIANASNYTIKTTLPIAGSLRGTISVVIGASILFSYLLVIRHVFKRSQVTLFSSILFLGGLYLLSIILCDLRGEPLNLVFENARSTFLFFLPAGVFAVSVKDKRILYETMLKYTLIIDGLMTWVVLSNFLGFSPSGREQLEYSMSLGYIIIVPTILHLNEFFRTKKWLYLVLAILEVLVIFLFASRGVLLSVFAFLLYSILIRPQNIGGKVFGVVVIIVAYIMFQIYGGRMLEGSIDILENHGISSRTLNMASSGNLDDDSGRLHLFRISIEMIKEKPILGWGIGGECYHIAQSLGHPEADVGHTSHNGVLQAMVQFGFLGGLLFTFLLIYPIFCVKRLKNEYLKNIIPVLFCAYIVPAVTISSGFFVHSYIAIYAYLFYLRNK